MNRLDDKTCDELSLRLSGLIGVFELLVETATPYKGNGNDTMSNFAFYISKELQSLFKTITGCDYR